MARSLSMGLCILCLVTPAKGAAPPEITELKQELAQLKRAYETQIRRLETRIAELERKADRIPTAPAAEGAYRDGRAFNPAVSLILSGHFSRFSRSPDSYAIPGFVLGSESSPGEEGLALSESELVLSANVDDKFFGRFTVALTPENEAEVEEAFVQTLALPGGFTVQAGRFFSEIGYLNAKHPHTWDFVDLPLSYRAMLHNQYVDDGVQLRWVAPTEWFLELGAEAFRGMRFPAAGAVRKGMGARAFFVRTGGDLGASHSWRLGLSMLRADARERVTPDGLRFDGESRLRIVDLVWKWAPQGNPYRTNFTFQVEHMSRRERGTYEGLGAYAATQSGWYVQGVYQFMPRWRFGVRYDRLRSPDPGPAFAGTALDPAGHTPSRVSLMLDFSNSEYSRLRLQYNRDGSRPERDDQWYVQYVMSLGAHGAHAF